MIRPFHNNTLRASARFFTALLLASLCLAQGCTSTKANSEPACDPADNECLCLVGDEAAEDCPEPDPTPDPEPAPSGSSVFGEAAFGSGTFSR